ncbi:aldo/keto reductase [Bordetella hinzii]|uniref:Oxidoreductase, aldo/keto reductase family protein n=1 Tax=Bordetella hinzii OH87 BAL007II TaxID=1331262 RepID=A0ABR4QZ59_9BORD|nr:aldo/keto reductase [Bordetella hinzii]AKQ54721.1 L-glyceraldehyde 3-phosphate reductase [Bordetella hinzii]KCB23460.1 oxidoreductase, aldo/keto reductase family protein [Bordetella hinzii OH87 BAL007II]KCB29897.1 oxidoreductase, aldo/keto reductase family protein [Bordetella hinzii L60]KCB30496.1 oxidoreductase, aldo/keto reductase family protein [Bordetella hinzii CA90 BAL1384]KCB39594.1 oxidoreductase, aldo/keto reductase family protein [Bordetella hinzii 5132]
MQTRPLGRSGLAVPPIVFGGNVFGWTVDEAGTFSLLDAMVDAGLNFIDTADVYSRWASGNQGGESETLIGKWLKKTGKRGKIVLATKVGMEMAPDRKGLAPAYIRQAVEDSLKRLQTDHIDLYQAHRDDPDTPLADTLEAFADLIQAGKVRAIGASNYSAARLSEALITSERLGLPRFESVQPEYNLYTREPFESGLQALVQAQDVGVINYYALASGFLSGKYRQAADAAKSVRGAKIVEKYLDERGQRILAALDEVAEASGATPAEVALAWQIAQPGITAPIASATTQEQLSELIGAARLQLSREELDRLSQASAWKKQ